jgi:hypothetical protein
MNSLKNDIRHLIFDGSLWMKSDLSKMNLKPCNLEEALEVINPMAGIIIELKKDNDLLRENLGISLK